MHERDVSIMLHARDVLIMLDELAEEGILSKERIAIGAPRITHKALVECWDNDVVVARLTEPAEHHEPLARAYKPIKPTFYHKRIHRQSVMRGK